MRKHLLTFVALFYASCHCAALAQSTPGFVFGQVPTAAQWNSYFAGKIDYTPSVAANEVFASPSSGGAGAPSFRAIVAADLASASVCFLNAACTVDLNSTAPTPQTGTIIQLVAPNSTVARAELDAFGASAFFTGLRADGTASSPTALQSGDQIAGFNAFGYDGASYSGPWATFRCYAAATWTSTSHQTYCTIGTTSGAPSSTLTDAVKFWGDGGLSIPASCGDMGSGAICVSALYPAHIIGNSGTPTAITGGGAGSGASATLTNAHDTGWSLSLTTGTGPTSSSTLVTVSFSATLSSAPNCEFSPAGPNAAALSGTTAVSETTNTTTWVLMTGSSPLSSSTTYNWQVVCLQ